MAPSYSERQAQYAAWRDRLRPNEEVIDLDQKTELDPWDPAALFAPSVEIDLDASTDDLGAAEPRGSSDRVQ